MSQVAIAFDTLDLLRNPYPAKTMGEAGHEKVQQRFTWEKLATITETAY
ncbi:MAG: hypothetical protein VKJ86_01715 [Synechococcus sp.]|nr:hypothetical protein [Synechococcus sp.]